MNERKIISAAITGTTFMTLFSYIVSAIEESNFKEPELLGKLSHRLSPATNKTVTQLAGWRLHYAIGLTFVIIYSWLWEQTKLKPEVKSGLLLGGISGLVGILAWKLIFRIHPNPPVIKFEKYYKQLLAAHFIFGLFAVVGYNLFRKNPVLMAAKPKQDLEPELEEIQYNNLLNKMML